MRKIVYCTSSLAICGGKEKILTLKANYLANQGWDVSFIQTNQRGDSVYFNLSPQIHVFDLNVNYSYLENSLSYFARVKYRRQKRKEHLQKLEYLLKEIKADIVVTTAFSEETPILYKIKDGSRKVLEYHGPKHFHILIAKKLKLGWKGFLYSRYITYLEKKFVKKYDIITTLTQQDKKAWGKNNNIIVIPNFITIPNIGQANISIQRVIAVGRLAPEKSFDVLLRCWSKIPDGIRKGWMLDIYGEGYLKSQLEKIIENLQLEECVRIHKPVKNIAKEYMESAIYCTTSVFEGFSLSLCEAMAAGLPSVTFDIPYGPREIILNDKMGFIIPKGREDIFIEKLQMLMTNPELRKSMGAEARHSVYERFTVDAVMQKWMNLFDSMLKN